MARLFLIAILLAGCAVIVLILASTWTRFATTSSRRLRPISGPIKDDIMASSGIQKAAYIALIIVLFGVATGWLGGL